LDGVEGGESSERCLWVRRAQRTFGLMDIFLKSRVDDRREAERGSNRLLRPEA